MRIDRGLSPLPRKFWPVSEKNLGFLKKNNLPSVAQLAQPTHNTRAEADPGSPRGNRKSKPGVAYKPLSTEVSPWAPLDHLPPGERVLLRHSRTITSNRSQREPKIKPLRAATCVPERGNTCRLRSEFGEGKPLEPRTPKKTHLALVVRREPYRLCGWL